MKLVTASIFTLAAAVAALAVVLAMHHRNASHTACTGGLLSCGSGGLVSSP
jgi:hypothetical protein